MRRTYRHSAMGILTIFTSLGAQSAECDFCIQGRVVEKGGRPVKAATVSFWVNHSDVVDSVDTDGQGVFRLCRTKPPENWYVLFSGPISSSVCYPIVPGSLSDATC